MRRRSGLSEGPSGLELSQKWEAKKGAGGVLERRPLHLLGRSVSLSSLMLVRALLFISAPAGSCRQLLVGFARLGAYPAGVTGLDVVSMVPGRR